MAHFLQLTPVTDLLLRLIYFYKQCCWCYALATFVLCSLVTGSLIALVVSLLVTVLLGLCSSDLMLFLLSFTVGKTQKVTLPPPPPPPFSLLYTGVHQTNVKMSLLCWESRAIKSSLFWATIRSEYNHFQAVYQLPGIPALCISVHSSSDFPCCLQI